MGHQQFVLVGFEKTQTNKQKRWKQSSHRTCTQFTEENTMAIEKEKETK